MSAPVQNLSVTRSRWRLSLADSITVSRMVAAPLLLGAALSGASQLFLILGVYGLATDALDGPMARLLNKVSERGAQLDSRADLMFYTTLIAGIVALFPARVAAEWMTASIVVFAYVTPIVVGWYKFHRLTSYHTLLARLSLVMLSIGLVAWLLFEMIQMLQAGVLVLVLSAFEELAITWKLEGPRDNVSHFFQLLTPQPLRRNSCAPNKQP